MSDLTPEQKKALDEMVDRRAYNTGESLQDAREYIAGYLTEQAAEPLPSGPQRFRYYLHDDTTSMERRELMEDQGVHLSDQAWEDVGRPFYEVGLLCEVEVTGKVTIKEIISS